MMFDCFYLKKIKFLFPSLQITKIKQTHMYIKHV